MEKQSELEPGGVIKVINKIRQFGTEEDQIKIEDIEGILSKEGTTPQLQKRLQTINACRKYTFTNFYDSASDKQVWDSVLNQIKNDGVHLEKDSVFTPYVDLVNPSKEHMTEYHDIEHMEDRLAKEDKTKRLSSN